MHARRCITGWFYNLPQLSIYDLPVDEDIWYSFELLLATSWHCICSGCKQKQLQAAACCVNFQPEVLRVPGVADDENCSDTYAALLGTPLDSTNR